MREKPPYDFGQSRPRGSRSVLWSMRTTWTIRPGCSPFLNPSGRGRCPGRLLDLVWRQHRTHQLGGWEPWGSHWDWAFGDTLIVLVLGQPDWVAVFGLLRVDGSAQPAWTGMVLSRAAFGRRGRLPAGGNPSLLGDRLVRRQHLDHSGPRYGFAGEDRPRRSRRRITTGGRS